MLSRKMRANLDSTAIAAFVASLLFAIVGLAVWSKARNNELNTVSVTVVSSVPACALNFPRGYGRGQHHARPCQEAESYAADTSKNVRSITRGHLVSVEFIDRRGQAQRREGFWVGSSPPALGSQVRASYNPVGGKIEQPITTLSEAGSVRYLFGLAFGLFVFAFAWLCVRLTLRRGAPQP
jgi:hypothetical protein